MTPWLLAIIVYLYAGWAFGASATVHSSRPPIVKNATMLTLFVAWPIIMPWLPMWYYKGKGAE